MPDIYQLAEWCLLHDAAEAYIRDIIRPQKARLGWLMENGFHPYEEVENNILRCIAEKFSLEWPMPEAVRVIDDRMLATERRDLFDDKQPAWTIKARPYDFKIIPVTTEQAERDFWDAFNRIFGAR